MVKKNERGGGGVDQWEGVKGRMKPVGQQRQAPRCMTWGKVRSVIVHEHPRERGGSLGKALRSRKSISVGDQVVPEDDTTTTNNLVFSFWRFFFTAGQKYHASAKSTRKCMSLI